MTDTAIPPLRRRTGSVGAEIAAHLARLIAQGHLRAGDRLPPERELAASLRVSRSSLREAMFELETKKLIERRQGRGSTVAEPPRGAVELAGGLGDLDAELGHALELRDLVEPRIARLAAARAAESTLLSLDEVLAHAGEQVGAEESMALDVEFHTLLAHTAQNPLLVTLSTMTAEWTRHTRVLSHRTELGRRVSAHGHQRILHAVRAHDPEAAGAAMELHLREVRQISGR
ncbi:GntR family transcriptional regulator [Nocardia sp. NPDC050712]|uniref:FadR/GntR family transcriptional regulator n=1 Tax=Nocardia sp. NPDC050712 TaxID=3155518 RepID=UPI0033F735DF